MNKNWFIASKLVFIEESSYIHLFPTNVLTSLRISGSLGAPGVGIPGQAGERGPPGSQGMF